MAVDAKQMCARLIYFHVLPDPRVAVAGNKVPVTGIFTAGTIFSPFQVPLPHTQLHKGQVAFTYSTVAGYRN